MALLSPERQRNSLFDGPFDVVDSDNERDLAELGVLRPYSHDRDVRMLDG